MTPDDPAKRTVGALVGLALIEDVPLTTMAFREQEFYGVMWNAERLFRVLRQEHEEFAKRTR